MNNKLLAVSAAAALLTGASALTAEAAPAPGVAAHTRTGITQNVHWDGGRRWDDDRPWWRHHRYWSYWRPWHRRSWHDHRYGWDRRDYEHHGDRGDHHGDRGDHREHRRGDWR